MLLRGIVQFEFRAETDVEFMKRFDAANQSFPGRLLPRFLQPLHQHHSVDKALQAHEVALRGRIVFPQRAAIERDCFVFGQVVRRHNLGDHHAFRIGSCFLN